jgi:hypothetical protein
VRKWAFSEETGPPEYGEDGEQDPGDPGEAGPGIFEPGVIADLGARCFVYGESVLVHLV